jgi:hypothetical protein
LERFFGLAERRQDRGQARGQHGLAAARRTDEQHVMRAAAAISSARRACAWPRTSARSGPVLAVRHRQRLGTRAAAFAAQEGTDLQQACDAVRHRGPRPARPRPVGLRQDHAASHRVPAAMDGRQYAVDAAQARR